MTNPTSTTPDPARHEGARPVIEAVVFDYGGVIINPITEHIGRLAERHGVAMEQLLHVLMGPREISTVDHPWHRAERGEIAIAGIIDDLGPWAAELGIELAGDEIDAILGAEYTIRRPVVEAIGALQRAGYRTALLTNSFREFRPFLEQTVDFSIFDVVVDSSEVGLRKPEPAIYDLTTERVGCSAANVLYLDDFLANVEGGRSAGWQVIHVAGERAVLDAIGDWTTVAS